MKVLFFDIDGTLMNDHNVFCVSAKEALRQAKKKGNKLFLCTGRTRSQILDEFVDFGFDGYVTVAGAEAIIDEKPIFQSFMDVDKVELFLSIIEPKHASFGLQTANGTLVTQEGWDKTNERFLRLGRDEKTRQQNMSRFWVVDDLHGRTDVEKMFYNFIDEPVDLIQKKLGPYFHVEQSSYGGPNPYSAEITKTGIDKATGMDAVMTYYGLSAADAIAFGDGPNDIEMMRYAGFSVCMGNGRPETKAVADYVTSDIDDDGIYKAMEYLGLI